MDVDKLAQTLAFLHGVVALITKNPLWNLKPDEAKNLSVSIMGVMQYHAINVNPKVVAYGELLAVAGMIYVPRAVIFAGQKQEKKKQEQFSAQMNSAPVHPQNIVTPSSNGKMVFQ